MSVFTYHTSMLVYFHQIMVRDCVIIIVKSVNWIAEIALVTLCMPLLLLLFGANHCGGFEGCKLFSLHFLQ